MSCWDKLQPLCEVREQAIQGAPNGKFVAGFETIICPVAKNNADILDTFM